MNFFKQNWIYLLVASLPFERIPSFDVNLYGYSITLRLSYIIAILAIGLLLLSILRKLSLNPLKPYVWMLAYLFVTVLSSFGAISRGKSIVVIIATAIVILAAILTARTVEHVSSIVLFKVLTIVSVLVCIIGLYQFFGDSYGLSTSLTGLKDIYTKKVFGFPRVQSTALEPLYLASFLLIPFVLTTSLLYVRKLSGYYYIVLGLYATVMALTLSRGGLFGGIGGLIVMFVLLTKHTNAKSALSTAGVIIIGGLIAVGLIAGTVGNKGDGGKAVASYTKQYTTLTSGTGSPDNDRVLNRRLAIRAFKERPLLGYGIGNFGQYAQRAEPITYANSEGRVIVNNEYLEVLAETGALGLLALVGLGVTLIIAFVSSIRQSGNIDNKVWVVALGAILVAAGVQYYSFSTLYIMHIWVTIGLLIGLTERQYEKARS